jgi:hypothetical protein
MHFTTCFAILSSILAGCAPPAPQESAANRISWADELIEGQRVIKRRLLIADPIERKIEAHLRRDPRVTSARFATLIPGFGMDGVSDAAPFQFETVVMTRDPMPDADAAELLRAVFESAGAKAGAGTARIVRNGNVWSASGTVYPTTKDNPNLSELPRE